MSSHSHGQTNLLHGNRRPAGVVSPDFLNELAWIATIVPTRGSGVHLAQQQAASAGAGVFPTFNELRR
jgi:hypothetical protein